MLIALITLLSCLTQQDEITKLQVSQSYGLISHFLGNYNLKLVFEHQLNVFCHKQ